ncbi:ABC transporter, putative [Bodo saltans]|uniref:ABC transporter, putative n=1 Tax=Bodo saltans TaxID=75058 RepID=A0A0S4IRS2_BODSA|nr:ABC transporter, putative [Bodo saltans]|eukprot:CUF11185.1 ABC transporter, putative [Bodo saltans]
MASVELDDNTKKHEPVSPSATATTEVAADSEVKKEVAMVPAGEVFRYADRTDKIFMGIGSFTAFCAGAGMPAFSFVFGKMINRLLETGADVESAMANASLIMTIVGVVVYVLQGSFVTLYLIAAHRQIARIKALYFAAILRQDMAWHDEHKPGELTARMTGDTRVLQNGINDKFANGIMQFGMFIFGFGFGFYYSWELTLLMTGTLPLIAGVGGVMANVMTSMTEQSRAHFAKAGAVATEVLENVRTVQTFGREDHETARFTVAVLDAQAAGIKKEAVSNLSIGATYCIMFCTYTIAFWFSAYLVEWGRNDVGEITATFFSVLMGSFGIGLVFPSITAFTEARAAANKIYEVIERVPEIDIQADGKDVNTLNTAIDFKNVRFSYPTRRDQVLFTDLSIQIPRGKKVAFSGASGCGKSSIIGLLQRYYDPVEGSVEIDGVNMRELRLASWRNLIGIVSQEPSLFSGSMADNVRIGKADATDEEVIHACRLANIHETIMNLPDQYNTSVGAVGSQLSGGQKQRLAIARAIIKKPTLLILDEATSALDRKSEVEVQAALDGLLADASHQMTVVVIAHRLATIRNVDCIYYIDYDAVNGSRITESGTFDELMALKGHFASMAIKQGAHRATDSAASPSPQAAASPSKKGHGEGTQKKEESAIPLDKLLEHEVNNAEVSSMRVMEMNKENMWAVALGLIGSLISGGIYPVYAFVFGRMLNILGKYATDFPKLHEQTRIFAPLFIALGVAAFVGWGFQAFYGYAGEKLTTKIRTALFRNILRQDMSFFDTPGRDAGALSGLLSGDSEAVHQLWGPSIGFKVQLLCNITVGLIIAFVHVWKLAFVTLSTMPIMILTGAVQQMLLVGFGHQGEGETTEDSVVIESLTNVRTVVSFNLGDERSKLYARTVADELPRNIKKSLAIGIVYGFTQFSFYGVFGLAFWYGGKLVARGEADFAGVIITTMAVMMGAMGAGEAGGFAAKLNDAQISSKRVFAVIDRKPSIDPYDHGDENIGDGCGIEFDEVKFIYPARPKQVVLKSLSAEFRNNTFNGLMGQTGCGKSTAIQMLARFYNPTEGEIRVNGKHMVDIDLQTWRKNISIVLQEPNLFSGSIRENIRYSLEGATDEEVERAARLASIHDDIVKMPNGYDTDVGYKGRALSGGQKQRVAIARGLLRKPKLLLLDEATSALDNATENKVQEGIETAFREHPMTVVSIAHRLTTIRHANKILLLDEGEILEEGNHDELMALNGEYKTRWELFAAASQ